MYDRCLSSSSSSSFALLEWVSHKEHYVAYAIPWFMKRGTVFFISEDRITSFRPVLRLLADHLTLAYGEGIRIGGVANGASLLRPSSSI